MGYHFKAGHIYGVYIMWYDGVYYVITINSELSSIAREWLIQPAFVVYLTVLMGTVQL